MPGSTPGERSTTRIRRGHRAPPVGDGAVDDGSLREHIEQARLRSARDAGQSLIPVAKQDPQFVAQLGEVAQASLEFGEPLCHQRADAPTGGTPAITFGYRQELRNFFAAEIPEELNHAQMLADKIAALGGTPSASPAPVTVVSDAKAMLEAALTAEVETIERYVRRRDQQGTGRVTSAVLCGSRACCTSVFISYLKSAGIAVRRPERSREAKQKPAITDSDRLWHEFPNQGTFTSS